MQSIKTSRWTLGFIALLLALILVACTSDTQRMRESNEAARFAQTQTTPTVDPTATQTAFPAPTSTPTATPTPVATLIPIAILIPTTSAPTRTPTNPPDTGEGMVRVPAFIHSVDLEVIKSAPPQYSLAVRSRLPNGCARFDGYTVYRQDATVLVAMTNLVPQDQTLCAEAHGNVESQITLGSELEPGVEYAAQVVGGDLIVILEKGSSLEDLNKDPAPLLDLPFHINVNELAIIEPVGFEIRFQAVLKDHRCIPVVERYRPEVRAEVLISAVDRNSGEEFRLELVLGEKMTIR